MCCLSRRKCDEWSYHLSVRSCYCGTSGHKTLNSAASEIVATPQALQLATTSAQPRRICISGGRQRFLPKSRTNIITIKHVPGAEAQVRGKATVLGGLNRLNSAINVFPPSVPQLPVTPSVYGSDVTCAGTYSPAATSSQHLSNSALIDTSSHFSTT